VVDTNCDPDQIDYVIPGNDDAIRSGALLTSLIADACAEGYALRAARSPDDVVADHVAAAMPAAAAAPAPEAEPRAEWEIALQQQEAAAAAQAAGVTPPVAEQAVQPEAPAAADPAQPLATEPEQQPPAE